ncbi:TPA: hypothetical protein ACH3X1_007341 [Trebouxia sp. C0004]
MQAAKKVKNRVYYSNASDQEKEIAVQCFHAVMNRVKKAWLENRAAELCEMASKDPGGVWRAFKTQKHNVCPVELAAQFEAFRALMGAQPAQTPEQAELSGTSVRATDASRLNAPVTSNELHDCIKRLKRNKSAGIDGKLSEMVKDGGEVFAQLSFSHVQFDACESLSQAVVCWLDTAVYKSGDKSDMSNYQGITAPASSLAALMATISDRDVVGVAVAVIVGVCVFRSVGRRSVLPRAQNLRRTVWPRHRGLLLVTSDPLNRRTAVGE